MSEQTGKPITLQDLCRLLGTLLRGLLGSEPTSFCEEHMPVVGFSDDATLWLISRRDLNFYGLSGRPKIEATGANLIASTPHDVVAQRYHERYATAYPDGLFPLRMSGRLIDERNALIEDYANDDADAIRQDVEHLLTLSPTARALWQEYGPPRITLGMDQRLGNSNGGTWVDPFEYAAAVQNAEFPPLLLELRSYAEHRLAVAATIAHELCHVRQLFTRGFYNPFRSVTNPSERDLLLLGLQSEFESFKCEVTFLREVAAVDSRLQGCAYEVLGSTDPTDANYIKNRLHLGSPEALGQARERITAGYQASIRNRTERLRQRSLLLDSVAGEFEPPRIQAWLSGSVTSPPSASLAGLDMVRELWIEAGADVEV